MSTRDPKAEYYRRPGEWRPPIKEHNEPLAKILSYLRDDLRGELEAINTYTEHMNSAMEAGFQDIASILHHILLDEKDHTASLTKLLQKYDAEQRRAFMKDETSSLYSSEDLS